MMRKAWIGLAAAAGLSLCVAAETAKITPDSTGTYTYDYPNLEANTPYVVLVTAGLGEEGGKPVITEESVLYYNVFFSDGDGVLPISFVPTAYRDATVFIASGGLKSPVIGCYALAEGAEGLSRIELSFDAESYTVHGEGQYTLAEYTVKAYDAFGFETSLPDDAVFTLDSNDGGYIRMLPDSPTLEISGMAHEGTYTLTVKTADTSVSKSFEVRRDARATTLRYTARSAGSETDTDYPSYIIFGTETVRGIEYEPASITFMPVVYDQYGEAMDADFTFSYVEYDKYKIAGDEVTYSVGPDCCFVPPKDPAIGENLTYDFIITSNTEPAQSVTISMTVVGTTVYGGKSLALYNKFGEALEYQAMIANGSILVATDGSAVPNTIQYVKPDMKQRLDQTVEETTALLIKSAESEGVSDDLIDEQMTKLQNTITAFGKALTLGSYSRITSLGFDSSHVYVAVGTSKTVTANVTPARPSERPVYSVTDPTVATVNASTGTVTAVREGDTTVTVSDVHGGISASYTLTVFTPFTTLSPVNNTVTANVGASKDGLFDIGPAVCSDIITYSSSDTKIASVGRTTGKVNVFAAGTAVITATSLTGKSASVTVNAVEPKLSVSPTSARPGSVASFRVGMEDAVDLDSLAVRFYYDPSKLTFVGVDDLGVLGSKPSTSLSSGYTEIIYKNISLDGAFSGSLFELRFDVADTVPFGTITVEYDADAKDDEGHSLSVAMPSDKKAAITVADVMPGDIDSNGVIDGIDLLRFAKYFAGYDVVINAANADIDGSGSIDEADLSLLADHFIGKPIGK